MARSMSLDVLVRLKDLLSSPLRRLTQGLRQLVQVGRSIGIIGTAIAAISFMGPIREAAAFEQKLIDIAATQNLAGQQAFSAVADMKAQYETLALEIGQLSDTVASGAGQMIAAGVDPKLVDASIGSIGRAATAANAEFSDMAAVAQSMLQSLQLPADQLDDSLGALVVAGKEGAFELKDMARFFPTLTSQMAKFGVTGREAVNFLGAALQIARKGTADPAEAANNLKNFLSKILAPATIKNFKDAGVDIEAVMRDAATKGINPIEAVMQKIVKLTGVSGGEIGKLMKKAKANGLEGAEALGFVREQLEQIHGAGALGELFSDMQVMDFLIPFLSNVDEFKRIKAEVAAATGAMIDGDFETQMQGLNRQLMIFQEIGAQAVREVGFAFGEWMPEINRNLMAALKWLRELDASTGGMVRQTIAWAGAGVLAAAAIGALALVLPVIGAGLSLLMVLLGPVGILLAGVGFAATHIYRNWASYGPRLRRIWDRAREGFSDLVDGIRTRGRQLLAVGRELVDRYGPMISAGLNSAWQDVKGGWTNIQSFIESALKQIDFKIDLSGLTIDNAKIVAFQALDVAMQGIAAAWGAVKDFGSGFALSLPAIGEDVGKTIDAIERIARGYARLASTFTDLSGLDTGRFAGMFELMGKLAGGQVQDAARGVRYLAEGLAALVEFSADLAEGKVDWSDLVPAGVTQRFDSLKRQFDDIVAAARALPGQMYDIGVEIAQRMIDGIKAKIDELIAWFAGLPERILAAIGTIDIGSLIKMPNLKSYFGFGGDEPTGNPSNDNNTPTPEKKASLDRPVGGSQLAALQPASVQKTKTDIAVNVAIEGPGKVTSATSSNKDVALSTGRRVARA